MTANQPMAAGAPDWSAIPAPEDDGATDHLPGTAWPDLALPGTDGAAHAVSDIAGRVAVYVYPRTGQPGAALPDGWDSIPGARGCTPQSCSFRDHAADLRAAGAVAIYGLSTQDTEYQAEAAARMRLPFPLLSDADLRLATALRLPTFTVDGMVLIKRMALILRDGVIEHVFYPVFPPDRNAADVLAWLQEHA